MDRPRGERFPKSVRIRRRTEFLRVQERGRKIQTPRLIGLVTPGATAEARIGITVTRRIGNAVARNRAKRLIREAFRTGRLSLSGSLDLVIIPKKAALSLDSGRLFEELERLGRLAAGALERQP